VSCPLCRLPQGDRIPFNGCERDWTATVINVRATLTTRQDRYIAIMGTIKVFGNKKHVAATHVRPIKDHNEVFNHFLRAVYVTLSLRNPGGVSWIFYPRCLYSYPPSFAIDSLFGHLLTYREAAEVLQRAQSMVTILPAQRRLDPTLLPMPTCHLSNDKSWRLSRRIRATMGCTCRQSREQRMVMPV
jgi:hypothetical protein